MANENSGSQQGGTQTMEPKGQFGAGIRGVERTMPGQQGQQVYRPTKEYMGKSQEFCLKFVQGSHAVTSINERLRAYLAKANIDASPQDTQILSQAINESQLLDWTSFDGSLYCQSWRTDQGNTLWVLVRHFEQQPIAS